MIPPVIPADLVARAWRDVFWLYRIEHPAVDFEVLAERLLEELEAVLGRNDLFVLRSPDEVGDEVLVFCGGTAVETFFLDLGPYDGPGLPIWTTSEFGRELSRVILLSERAGRERLRYFRLRSVLRSRRKRWWLSPRAVRFTIRDLARAWGADW